MPRSVLNTWISWVITGCIYVTASLFVIFLIWQEINKRKTLKILSWNGRYSKRDSTNKNVNDTSSKYSYIEGSIHYLSYSVYLWCILYCLFGILRLIPALCDFYVIQIWMICLILIKMFIQLLQLQRFMLCFVSINMNNTKKHCKSYNLANIMLIVCFFIVILATAITVFSFLQNIDLFVLDNIWCYWTYKQHSDIFLNRYHTIFIVFIGDWAILIAYIIQIWQLSKKIKQQLVGINNNNIVNLKRDGNVIKLKNIVTRILVCSIMMEITFIPGVVLSAFVGLGEKDSLYLIPIHFFLAIDCICNVIFVSFMLQHNTKDYVKFWRKLGLILKFFKDLYDICRCNLHIWDVNDMVDAMDDHDLIMHLPAPNSHNDSNAINTIDYTNGDWNDETEIDTITKASSGTNFGVTSHHHSKVSNENSLVNSM